MARSRTGYILYFQMDRSKKDLVSSVPYVPSGRSQYGWQEYLSLPNQTEREIRNLQRVSNNVEVTPLEFLQTELFRTEIQVLV